MNNLWAKSLKPGSEPITLAQHTRDVVEAAIALFGTLTEQTRLGQRWLTFFGLKADTWPVFHANLVAACALHDWGKANDGMQAVLRGTGSQAIRHEHLSALLIGMPKVTAWLTARPNLDVPLILSAVLTHHLKAAFDPSKRYGFAGTEPGGNGFRCLHWTAEFTEVLADSAALVGAGALDLSDVAETWSFGRGGFDVRPHRDRIRDAILEPLKKALRADEGRKRLLLAVRAALIAADAAGSGLVREQQTIGNRTVGEWVRDTFAALEPWSGRQVMEKIIDPRVAQLKSFGKWNDKGDGKNGWSDFQLDCDREDKVPARALLLAPCGSGKTLAAWRWIAAQLDRAPARHVLFLYPTRATAREGFKDYVSWAPEAEAALMHGTSRFDLADMFANEPDDPRKGRDYEAERRLFALGLWGRRAFSATVDQFLAFLQYSYGSVCMLPVLADSVVVIDEVHSFDRKMLSALKEFLTTFSVPVLCMTATLPGDRKADLVGCKLTAYEERPGELETIARAPRYRLEQVASREAATARVRQALADGQRVLWVVNTVRRAQDVVREFTGPLDPAATELRTSDGIPVLCYHSRFRLIDRVGRHAQVVAALKAGCPAALGVTTQVCEMSLDIDVDLLVTEECPVTAAVQRMGRCNRERTPRSLDQSGAVVVYKPESEAPYSRDDLTGLPEFLKLTDRRELSQDDLERAMAAVPCPPWGGDTLCSFTASGPYAVGGEEEFRDTEEFNRPCVLDADVPAFLAASEAERHGDRKATKDGFVLPAPRKLSKLRDDENNPQHRKLARYLGVAPSNYYHPLLGLCEQVLTMKGGV